MLVLAVLSPERAMVADPRTGATRERRLAGGTLCHGPVLAVGDRVLVAGTHGRVPITRSLPLSLAGPGRSLGAADTITVSRTPGRVWLGRWHRPRRWSASSRSRVSLLEVDAVGRAGARVTVRLPSWGALEAVLDDGLLVSHEGGLTLHGGETPTIPDAWLVAAGSSRFAWCRGACRRVTVWSRDAARKLDPPAGVRPLPDRDAAFSPGEDRLALPVQVGRRSRVAVIDLESGAWRLVPGRLGEYGAVAWSPSGAWLYFADDRDRVRGWRAGAARSVRLPIRTGGTVMSIAVS
jgi:dipeptidyl aminopeptidase/acylaminoacyl peptidase